MLPQFNTPRQRLIWVKAQLSNIGSSFAAIALENGWSRTAVSNAMSLPLDAQERAIAEKLGVSQQALFPERYGPQGKRLHPVKNSPSSHPRNVKESRVA